VACELLSGGQLAYVWPEHATLYAMGARGRSAAAEPEPVGVGSNGGAR
jgi:hypothetical protein